MQQSQSYSYPSYPPTHADRLYRPARHQSFDPRGIQTQSRSQVRSNSPVFLQQDTQSRPGAISPVQRERRPLPSPDAHGRHTNSSSPLHSMASPNLPVPQPPGNSFAPLPHPRPLPHSITTTGLSYGFVPQPELNIASNTGRKPLPRPPSSGSPTVAAMSNTFSGLRNDTSSIQEHFHPKLVPLSHSSHYQAEQPLSAGSASLPSSPVREGSFTPLWKHHKRMAQPNAFTSPQDPTPRRALPTPIPRADVDGTVNAFNQLAQSGAQLKGTPHHALLARSKTMNSFGSNLTTSIAVNPSEAIPITYRRGPLPQPQAFSGTRSVQLGPDDFSTETDVEPPPPIPPRPGPHEIQQREATISQNSPEKSESLPTTPKPPLPPRPRLTDSPEVKEPIPRAALTTAPDTASETVVGLEAAVQTHSTPGNEPTLSSRSLKGKEKAVYPEAFDTYLSSGSLENISMSSLPALPSDSPASTHRDTERTERQMPHVTDKTYRSSYAGGILRSETSSPSAARAPIKRATLPVIPTSQVPNAPPPVHGPKLAPLGRFSRPQEPQSMAMRLATQALAQEQRERSKKMSPRSPPQTFQYDEDEDEDSDSGSEFNEPISPPPQLPSISVSVDRPSSESPRPRSDPRIPLEMQSPTSEATFKPPSCQSEDIVSILVPIPQISFPDSEDAERTSDLDNLNDTGEHHDRSPSITFSPTPSAGARVQMGGSTPFRATDGTVVPNIAPGSSLRCAGCRSPIVGRIVSAMNLRWHPACFKCVECGELLEHVSAFEHGGHPYCHLDFHERFSPKCYHCKTPIADERFITLDDPALGGQRYYHELHFFCAECGDPFLDPSRSSAAPKGTRVEEDDVGFTVYKGHPYCEPCHVRLRIPRCGSFLKPGLRLIPGIGCGKPIRDGAIEAIGRRWHPGCFTCSTCQKPFEDPSFFQRGEHAYCDPCYRILVKSEL